MNSFITQAYPLGAIRLFDSEILGDPWQDWSGVRSKGRAARRLKRGFPQRIVTRYKPNGKLLHDKINNIIYAHPVDRMRLEAGLNRRSITPPSPHHSTPAQEPAPAHPASQHG